MVKMLSSKKRRRLTMGVATLSVAAFGLTAYGVASASAGSSAAGTGTVLCVKAGAAAIQTPSASGTCAKGRTPVTVANSSTVNALSSQVGSIQTLTPVTSSTSEAYVPATTVHELRVELWGGGGGGGGGGSGAGGLSPIAGGGGAQGDYTTSVINVVGGEFCALSIGSGGAPGLTIPAQDDGSNGQPGGTTTFSCIEGPSLSAPGGVGGGGGGAGGTNPATSQSGAFQTYPGQAGGDPVAPDTVGAPGGGVGFPGTGGSGGDEDANGLPGTNGYAIITPVG